MQRPTGKGLINWLGNTTENLANSVEDLNKILEEREKDPQWSTKAWSTTRNMFSLRKLVSGLPANKADADKPHKVKVRREVKVEEIEEIPSVSLE